MSDSAAPIHAFWSWWQAHREELTQRVGKKGFPPALIEQISSHVHAMDPALTWEFGAGTTSTHGFTVSPNGNPSLFGRVLDWLDGAPSEDPVFEFHGSKQRVADGFEGMQLQMGPHTVGFGDLRFTLEEDADTHLVDVVLHHPVFAAIPEDAAGRLLFVLLDNLFGEAVVGAWMGQLSTSAEPGEVTPAEARARFDVLATEWNTGACWQMLQVTQGEETSLLLVDRAARRWLCPRQDHTATITLNWGSSDEGLPDPATYERMQAWADQLDRKVGEPHRHVAVHTGAGQRTIFYVLTADHADAKEAIEAAVADWGDGATAELRHDPTWEAIPRV